MSGKHLRKFMQTEDIYERHRQRDAAAYESRTVEYVLQRFGLKKQALGLLAEQSRRNDRNCELRFRFFNELYPTFPIMLGTQRLEKLHLSQKMLLPALFKFFDQTPMVEAYAKFYEEAQSSAMGRPIGLVFPRKGIMRGLIIHNGEKLDESCFHGLSLVYHGGSKKHRHKLFVQSFQQLIESLFAKGHGWQP